MEQDLWYRWRELERAGPARQLTSTAGSTHAGWIERSRLAIGHALIRVGVVVAGLSSTPARSALP